MVSKQTISESEYSKKELLAVLVEMAEHILRQADDTLAKDNRILDTELPEHQIDILNTNASGN